MEWTRAIDAYCERSDPGFWAEPVNAVTNLAFVLAAIFMWRRTKGAGRFLTGILFLIGLGSFLFHTFATGWSAMLDTVPILAFVLVYIFLANRDFWGWPLWLAVIGALGFLPYAAMLTPVFARLPFFEVSGFYWPLPVLIFAYAVLLRPRLPVTARNLAIGAGLLCASLTARSLDEGLCNVVPIGTHFLWHILNAGMLAWMIETWTRFKRQPDAPR